MLPLTLLAANKLLALLTTNGALSGAVNVNSAAAGITLPALGVSQIVGSYADPDMADLNLQMTYPRVCVYASQVGNKQTEKFRTFSGTVTVIADVWSSDALEQSTETGVHFFVNGVTNLLQANQGDWGDGFRYSGIYGVSIQPPKIGGFGFVQLGRITCELNVTY